MAKKTYTFTTAIYGGCDELVCETDNLNDVLYAMGMLLNGTDKREWDMMVVIDRLSNTRSIFDRHDEFGFWHHEAYETN
ncbi:MAG: hypothetical protein J6Y20_07475 [Lachnospiraceae bacterium]|nr:hypothetical protein [Lachnospiraceae bacterium]